MTKQPISVGRKDPDPRFSSGIACGDLVFVSGQGPVQGGVRAPVGETIEDQADLTLRHVRRVLEAGGCTMDDCVKVTVYLKDLSHYDRFNAVYRTFFTPPLPARTLVGCDLNWGILVEIDAIAVRGAGGGGGGGGGGDRDGGAGQAAKD